MVDLQAGDIRSYISETDRGRRNWKNKPAEKAAVYANRRRIRGLRGQRLRRKRGEFLERAFAPLFNTGGMRRLFLKSRQNILKRLLIHVCGFNLSLLMRRQVGCGTPRGMEGIFFLLSSWIESFFALPMAFLPSPGQRWRTTRFRIRSTPTCFAALSTRLFSENQDLTTGC